MLSIKAGDFIYFINMNDLSSGRPEDGIRSRHRWLWAMMELLDSPCQVQRHTLSPARWLSWLWTWALTRTLCGWKFFQASASRMQSFICIEDVLWEAKMNQLSSVSKHSLCSRMALMGNLCMAPRADSAVSVIVGSKVPQWGKRRVPFGCDLPGPGLLCLVKTAHLLKSLHNW